MSYPSELPDKENINGYYLPFNYDESTGTWNDLVGTNHFTQSDANSRPLLKDDIVNSNFKYVLFTASPWRRMTLPTDIAYENNSNNLRNIFSSGRGKDVNADGTFSSYDNNGRFLQDRSQTLLDGGLPEKEVFRQIATLTSNDEVIEKNWTICVLRRINGSNKFSQWDILVKMGTIFGFWNIQKSRSG